MSKKHELEEYTAQSGKNLQLGQAGYVHLKTDSTSVETTDEGHYTAISILEDNCLLTLVSSVHRHSGSVGANMLLQPVPKGITIHGFWSKISISRPVGEADTSIMIYKG